MKYKQMYSAVRGIMFIDFYGNCNVEYHDFLLL